MSRFTQLAWTSSEYNPKFQATYLPVVTPETGQFSCHVSCLDIALGILKLEILMLS